MMAAPQQSKAWQALLATAAVVVVLAGIKVAQSILVPVLLSIVIAVLTAPLLVRMKRRGLSTPIALLVMVSLIIIVGLGLGVIVGQSLDAFLANMDTFQANLTDRQEEMVAYLDDWGWKQEEDLDGFQYLDTQEGVELFKQLLLGLSTLFSQLLLILFLVCFMLFEAHDLPRKIETFSGEFSKARLQLLSKMLEEIRSYMSLKTLTSAITGLLIAVILYFLNVDYAEVWGLLAFLLNFIPNIGSIIAAAPAIALALVNQGVGMAIVVGIVYLAVNMIIGNMLEPRWMGRGSGLSLLVVFLSLIFWGFLLGPIGMLLSVPLTKCLQIALDADPKTRWMAILMSSPDSVHAQAMPLAQLPHLREEPPAPASPLPSPEKSDVSD